MRPSRWINKLGRILAAIFALQWMLLQYVLYKSPGLTFGERFWVGNDFTYLYSAAGYFLSGKNPYLEPDFIPLPPALYVPLLLHRLSFWHAFTAFRAISFLLIVAAILWLCRQLKVDAVNAALLLLVTISYGPLYILLAGGNLDGLMLALLIFSCAAAPSIRGVALGLSIGTKFYSGLMLPVLIMRRRWREVLWALISLFVLLLPFVRYWPSALSSIFHRTSLLLRLADNQSPAVLAILLFGQQRPLLWKAAYALFWGGTLLARLVADARRPADGADERFLAIEYIPWMAAAPVLVFTYTGTILLAVMVLLVHRNQSRRLLSGEWLMVCGFLLTGLYWIVGRWMLSPFFTSAHVNRVLLIAPPLGISAILIGSSVASWQLPGKAQ